MDRNPTPFPVKKSRTVMKPTVKPIRPLKKDLKTQPIAENESREGSGGFQFVSVDRYRTPYPASKNRGVAKPIAKTSKHLNNDLKIQPTTQVQSRTKRVFGDVKNPNIPIGKPKANPSKPTKVTKPIKKSCDENKKNIELKVRFERDEVAMRTPLAAKKFTLEEEEESFTSSISYFDDEDWIHCENDPLNTSSYWLDQIKLSESVGKHVISAGFFFFALKCNAEPKEEIHAEIKNYMEKHNSEKIIPLFADLFSLTLDTKFKEAEELSYEPEFFDFGTEEMYFSKEGQCSNSNENVIIEDPNCSNSSFDSLNSMTENGMSLTGMTLHDWLTL